MIAAVYIALNLLNWAFNTDVRIWVFNIKPIDAAHFPIVLAYVIPFILYFLALGVTLHGQLRVPNSYRVYTDCIIRQLVGARSTTS